VQRSDVSHQPSYSTLSFAIIRAIFLPTEACMSLQNYPTAPLLRRLAALAYDGLILIALYIMVGMVLVAIIKTISGEFPGGFPASVNLSLMFTICFLYYSHSWRKGGQTIGMKAWRLRITTLDGSHIRLSHCMLRTSMGFFSLVIFGVGFFWAWLDKQQRTWHDMASLTRIVYLPKDMA
jgi:uncharacterized RDD family membrane protein YckC